MSAYFVHVFACFALLVKHVRLYLIDHRCNLHICCEVHEMIREEIAHSDSAHFASLIGFLQVAIGTIAVAEWLVKEHEVDVVV